MLFISDYDIVGLLRVYSSLILNTQTSYDISLLYRIFGILLKEAYTQCNLDWCNLYQFFTTVINSLRLVFLCICVSVHVRMSMCACVSICVYVCLSVCLCLSVSIYVSVCVCVCVFCMFFTCIEMYMYMCFSFYSRNGGVTKYIDQLLATFNVFTAVSAFNCRARLCVLGETMMTILIQLLGNRTQPSKVKVRKL